MKSTLFLVNIVLTTKVKKLQEEIRDLNDKIQKYETQAYSGNMPFNGGMSKKKRKRKTKDQVERNFKCNIGDCSKSYGSENSLNQHMKLKHPEFWAKIKEKENTLTTSGLKEESKSPGVQAGSEANPQNKVQAEKTQEQKKAEAGEEKQDKEPVGIKVEGK